VTKTSGLGQNFYIGGYNLSGDVCAVSAVKGTVSVLDVTDISQSAYNRVAARRDGEITFNTWYDVAAGREHAILKTLPLTDTMVMYVTDVPALDAQAACLSAIQVNYDWTRAADGSLMGTVQCLADDGNVAGNIGAALEWCEMLTPGVRTDTTATAPATGVDFGSASTLFGLSAYLQVFSVTGTSVTVSIDDSADNSTFAPVTGAQFAAATSGGSPQVQRIQTTAGQTVRRYVRASTTGTFSNAQFAVAFYRHLISEL
jgi:hypothetical protein